MNQSSTISSPFNVRDFGALGDGVTLDTAALQGALDVCHTCGGGTVFLPAGKYLTGPLVFHSNITFTLDAGAELLGSQFIQDYPLITSRWEGAEQTTYAPLIYGINLENVSISGRGKINGQGEVWWQAWNDGCLAYPRPRLISFVDSQNILIENITVLNSPSWTINPVRCENVHIHGLTVINPPDSPNTDGINPDSCRYVRISDCYVSVGDDCITIKSGTQHERPERQAPCRDITITNCTLARGHGGVVIGSEMSGGVENVTISNCVFIGTDRGIRLKSRRGRGGLVQNIRVSNIIMTDVLCPFTVNLYYGCGAWGDAYVSDKNAHPVTTGTPQFKHIYLSQITARNVKYAAGFIFGLAEMPAEDISIRDFNVSLIADGPGGYPEMADGLEITQQTGFYIRNVRRLCLERIKVDGQKGPAIQIVDSSDVEISAGSSTTLDEGSAFIDLNNVQDAFIHSCKVNAPCTVFLRADGERTRRVRLSNNALEQAGQILSVADEIHPDAIQVV